MADLLLRERKKNIQTLNGKKNKKGQSMTEFAEMSKEELEQAKEAADRDYEELKARNLSLDMSRGKPAPSRLITPTAC